jgi:hypothetical protein
MPHSYIEIITAVVNGYCEVHDQHPRECGALREAAGWTILGLGAAALARHSKS